MKTVTPKTYQLTCDRCGEKSVSWTEESVYNTTPYPIQDWLLVTIHTETSQNGGFSGIPELFEYCPQCAIYIKDQITWSKST